MLVLVKGRGKCCVHLLQQSSEIGTTQFDHYFDSADNEMKWDEMHLKANEIYF